MSYADLTCVYCLKRIKSYGGMTKHVRACKKNPEFLMQRLRWKGPIQLRNPVLEGGLQNWKEPLPSHTTDANHAEEGYENEGLFRRDDVVSVTAIDTPRASSPTTTGTWEDTATQGCSEGRGSHSKTIKSGLLSATSLQSLHHLTFPMRDQRSAGDPIALEHAHTRTTKLDVTVYGFKSQFDFAFASWLHKIQCTQGDIDLLTNDQRLRPLVEQLSYTSGHRWANRLERLPSGFNGDGFVSENIRIIPKDPTATPLTVDVVHRSALDVIQFLIGHQPFRDVLRYAPVKLYRDNSLGTRVYNELYSGDWWWDTQEKLPPGATLVPILISVDKTLMTMLHGDTVCWPVYMTIGNLDRDTRRAHDRCGIILVGFVPTVEYTNLTSKQCTRFELYHQSMAHILQPLEALAIDGVDLICADGMQRRCHPIICGIIADYQEQTLITGVKNNRHCTICRVPPSKRGDLLGGPWPLRTHEHTRSQIEIQRITKIHPSHDDWVHDMDCFAWRHAHFNIHEGMLVDTLHQLLKGLVMYTIKWLQQLINKSITRTRGRRSQRNTIGCQSGKAQLDQRFKDVPIYTTLRRFVRVDFSKVTQWTGDEQKAIVKQLVAVVTPLLCETQPYAIHFTKAVCDFVTIAQYRTHDDETISYLRDALKRIDALKDIFESFRPRKKDEPDVGHFEIPKLHSLTHWEYFIKSRGSPDGYDTGPNGEAPHSFLLKELYKLTNKKEFLLQLGRLNCRKIAVLSQEAHLANQTSTKTTEAQKQFHDMHVTAATGAVHIRKLGWGFGWNIDTRDGGIKKVPERTGVWLSISEVAKYADIPTLPSIVRTFVQDQHLRRTVRHSASIDIELDGERIEATNLMFGMEQAMLQIHPSMQCWRRNGKHPFDTEALDKILVRCRPWGKEQTWRKDYVIATDFGDRARPSPNPEDDSQRLHGKTVGRVDLIFTVRLEMVNSEGSTEVLFYTGAVLNQLRILNEGRPHPIHGMIELQKYEDSSMTLDQSTVCRKAFSMPMIWRSIHIVPAGADSNKFYINNYIDFEIYNEFYSPTFEKDGDMIIQRFRLDQNRSRAIQTKRQQSSMRTGSQLHGSRETRRQLRQRKARPTVESDDDIT